MARCWPKKKKAKRYSGGLALYFRQHIKNGITIIPSKNPNTLWIKLKADFFNSKNDTFICFVYISPSDSAHNISVSDLDEIRNEIAMKKNLGNCLIVGDMNGYTQMLEDFNTFDDNN